MMRRLFSIIIIAALMVCMVIPESALTAGAGAAGGGFTAFAAQKKAGAAEGRDGTTKSEGTGSTNTIDEIVGQFVDPDNDPFSYTREADRKRAIRLAASEYPAKFDLLAKFMEDGDATSYVTPVKFQNPWGNC